MIAKSVVLRCSQDRAFALFTENAGQWWPAERRHTGDTTSDIYIEPSGRFFERASDGTEVELGVVRLYDAPRKLVLDWYPGTDRANATQVEVRFEPAQGGTRVMVTHTAGAANAEIFARNVAGYARSWSLVMAALGNAGTRLA